MPSQPNNQTGAYRPGRLGTLLVLLFWLAALGLVYANRQALFDWWQLRHYQAPAAIASLASQDTMTGYARKVFYVNHPQLEDKSTFFNDCPSGNSQEQTIVLGCYHGGQAGIFLLDVSDPRLNGVEQVTAAHEMLHAAYDRLGAADKQRVDQMLLDYYHHGLHDQRILKTIDAYKQTEPNDVVNEMHSIFGTEVANLPAPLEQYYKRYFSDRSQIAAFAAQYQSEFTSRQAAVAQDDVKLASLREQINTLEADLRAKQANISSLQNSLVAERNSGNTTAYNAAVPQYNAQVDAYNAEVAQLRGLISQYNQLVSQRNAVAADQNQLVQELSSNAQTIGQ